jgi:hypothetical protein
MRVEITLMSVKITLERVKAHSGVKFSVFSQKYIQKLTRMRLNFTRKRVIFTRLRVEFFTVQSNFSIATTVWVFGVCRCEKKNH